VNTRNPAWEFNNNTGRPITVADPSNGPGTYDDGRKFGDDAEAHEFGQRRESKIHDGPGPWTYRPENADGVVKPRNPAWELKNSTGRPNTITDPNNGPGTYDDGR